MRRRLILEADFEESQIVVLMVFGITCIRIIILICVCMKSIAITLELLYIVGICFDECWFMGPRGHFYLVMGLAI